MQTFLLVGFFVWCWAEVGDVVVLDRGRADRILTCPWARCVSEFQTAERSAPGEVIMESLVFIDGSINSLQIYYGRVYVQ